MFNDKISDVFDLSTYSSYLFENNIDSVKKNWMDLHLIFYPDLSNEKDRIRKTDEMYFIFESKLKKEYKKKAIDDAVKLQNEYKEKKIIEKIKTKIFMNIKEIFSEWFSTEKKSGYYYKRYKSIHVLCAYDYTRFMEEDRVREMYLTSPFTNFIEWLVTELKESYGIKIINRNESFVSDEKFRQFLQDNGYNHLVGSKYVFDYYNVEEYKKHQDFIKEKKCNFDFYVNEGIAMKDEDVYIKLNDVKVDIHPTSLEEMKIYKDERGLMKYSPVSGLTLEFEEQELKDYIRDERKTVNIYFDISLALNINSEFSPCVIITRDYPQKL